MERVKLWKCESCGDTFGQAGDTCCGLWPKEYATFVRLDEVVAMVEEAAEEQRKRADANFDSPVLGRFVEKYDFAADKIQALASQLKGTP